MLTQGIFISGYIVFLGGSDFLTGIINSSVSWASLASLFSFFLFERKEKRKGMLISLLAVSRLLVCCTIFVPLVVKQTSMVLYAVTVMVAIGNILWGVYSIGYMVWLVSVLPKEIRNSYMYMRMLYLRISFTVFTVIMGFVLDWFNKSYTGFLIIFLCSLLLAITDILILLNIEEPANTGDKTKKLNFAVFWEPLKHSRYAYFLMFTFFFYTALTMSSSYTPLYLIRYLKLDYSFVSVVTIIMYAIMIVCTTFWRRVEDRKGILFVLSITALFMAAEFLIYGFLTRERYYLLFFTPIIAGIGNSGFNICIMTYRYEIMPEENRTIYEGWFGAVIGLSNLTGPMIGGVLIKILPIIDNALFRYGNFQLLYIISFLLAVCIILFFFYFKKISARPSYTAEIKA